MYVFLTVIFKQVQVIEKIDNLQIDEVTAEPLLYRVDWYYTALEQMLEYGELLV